VFCIIPLRFERILPINGSIKSCKAGVSDRKTSWMADLTVLLTDVYHVVSFSSQVKKLIKTRVKTHP